jgi:tyrosyl-tRNA synthetase
MMIQKESVKNRLEGREQGISYTEFSYMILQAYDFLRLYEDQNVTVQVGGSDQWGNIVAGSDLIRRAHFVSQETFTGATEEGARVEVSKQDLTQQVSFGLTAPLVTKSDGGKFGKTEGGAIWLTADRTSPYAFYQFWLNASDEDAARYMKLFTLLPQDEIESIIETHTQNPGAREAQRRLAQEITTLVHGDEGVQRAEAATQALFSGDVASLDEVTLNEVFADVASTEHSKSELAGEGVALVDLLPLTSLAKSKREAREFLSNGSVSVNGAKVSLDDRLTAAQLLHGSVALLKRGKKTWHVTRWM